MLKFISTDIEHKNMLSRLLDEKDNLEEYLNKNSDEQIFKNIEHVSEKFARKDKNTVNYVNKIIAIMLFELSNKTNFSFNDKTTSIVEKLISISSMNNKNNSLEHLENLNKFYQIVADKASGRYFLIQKILKFLNEAGLDFLAEFRFELIENIIFNFLKHDKDYDKQEMLKFFDLFCQFIRNNKMFKNLEK